MFGRGSSGPLDWWMLGWSTSVMLAEAQAVIAMRTMGMAGLWSVTRTETKRMVAEKSSVFSSAIQAAGRAVVAGKHPHQIAEAALRPIRRKTRANSRRLARRGPGKPK